MVNGENEENEHLTGTELIALKKSGNSYSVRFPRAWMKTLREFQFGPVLFAVHVERSSDGRILLVGEKTKLPKTITGK